MHAVRTPPQLTRRSQLRSNSPLTSTTTNHGMFLLCFPPSSLTSIMPDVQYNDSAAAPVDPYSDAYNALPPPSSGPPLDARDRDPPPPRDRSRSRSPVRGGGGGYRSPPPSYPARRRSPPPRPKAVPSVCRVQSQCIIFSSVNLL